MGRPVGCEEGRKISRLLGGWFRILPKRGKERAPGGHFLVRPVLESILTIRTLFDMLEQLLEPVGGQLLFEQLRQSILIGTGFHLRIRILVFA